LPGICTRCGDSPNVGLMEFCCDELSEVNCAPTMTKRGTGSFAKYKEFAPMGSTLICRNEGDIKVYMLFSSGWQEL